MLRRLLRMLVVMGLLILTLSACADDSSDGDGGLGGTIIIDGSSTVEPISTLASSFFTDAYPGVDVPVGTSGTGGGFEKFCNGETDISDASRLIRESEGDVCAANGIEFISFQVGIDALTVVVNSDNGFVKCLTTEQLAVLYGADSEGEITKWNQVEASFPDVKLELYAPDADSGTFDFFHEEITDDEFGGARTDYTPSSDDNVLIRGVQGSQGGIAYFGLSYYLENQDILKAVAVDDGNGCVLPSFETALDGSYRPLARPLFIYVKLSELARPEVQAFVEFYLSEDVLTFLVPEVGYASMSEDMRQAVRAALADAVAGL